MRVEGFNVLATFHTVPSIPSDNMRDAREPAPRGGLHFTGSDGEKGGRERKATEEEKGNEKPEVMAIHFLQVAEPKPCSRQTFEAFILLHHGHVFLSI